MSDAEMISTLKTDVYFAGAYRDHYVRRKAAFFHRLLDFMTILILLINLLTLSNQFTNKYLVFSP